MIEIRKGVGSHFGERDPTESETHRRFLQDMFGLQEQWYSYFIALDHIEFEKLDNVREYGRMMEMLNERDKGDFLLFHLLLTESPAFHWNILEHAAFRKKYARFL